ncbi:hypothetical protein J5N97_029331 [Dioscorea zingiberensis]|uniref:Fungal lipase-type domain-containing protein n=1 Tax=Dioscorea zingiberensis TaxID=325984 RepID=A0A9D5C175_9LILI|nr:hypothetical protein J5N97_029331 [Dioscorea zingiberensis]
MLAGAPPAAPHLSFSPALTSSSSRTHLSNLNLLLNKPSPQPPPPPPQPLSKKQRFNFNLNLPSIFRPTTTNAAAADDSDMSPRTLNHLHHLLSDSTHPSPKNNISSHWPLYHGSGDWSGLLDPLDENLRRELIRYGEFIQAAYHAFHSDPSLPPDAHRAVSLSDHSYKLTRSLFATTSIHLPRWVDNLAPWASTRSSWIGFTAVCDDDQEIKRMGRRDIVIVLRGTSTLLEWAENFRTNLVPIDSVNPFTKVECGFRSLFTTSGDRVPSLSSAVADEIRRLTKLYEGEKLSITVTGHSLGAALAILVADELSSITAPIAVFSFGGPRVGNRAFAHRVRRRGVGVLRVVNAGDVVTMVPGAHVLRSSESWDGYAHVGRELRVDSRVSPYLRPNPDPACCHDLEAYLHLVDGYLGPDSPFRSNAKRSLVKLLSQQGSNVKKLYVSKARALGF